MQGRLRQERLTVQIDTVCAQSRRSMSITVSSDMEFSVHAEGSEPLVFLPQIDWETFTEPNIIDAY